MPQGYRKVGHLEVLAVRLSAKVKPSHSFLDDYFRREKETL
jgi:hypothetical protein